MMASRGMGDMSPSKMPGGKRKARRDDTDFTQYKDGGKVTEAQREKIATVMDEYGQGELNIGLSDKKVTNRKQAVAIALSEAGVSKKPKSGWKHKK